MKLYIVKKLHTASFISSWKTRRHNPALSTVLGIKIADAPSIEEIFNKFGHASHDLLFAERKSECDQHH
jgi:hypothetical protein